MNDIYLYYFLPSTSRNRYRKYHDLPTGRNAWHRAWEYGTYFDPYDALTNYSDYAE